MFEFTGQQVGIRWHVAPALEFRPPAPSPLLSTRAPPLAPTAVPCPLSIQDYTRLLVLQKQFRKSDFQGKVRHCRTNQYVGHHRYQLVCSQCKCQPRWSNFFLIFHSNTNALPIRHSPRPTLLTSPVPFLLSSSLLPRTPSQQLLMMPNDTIIGFFTCIAETLHLLPWWGYLGG